MSILGPFWVHLGPFWVHFGSILGPFWVHFGSILGPFWVHFGSILGPFWVHFGSILGPFWVHFGSILGPFWVHFGSILGPFWVQFGSILGPFSVHSRSILMHLEPHRSETNGFAERAGIAERAVRRVKEGTSIVLLQSGLNESWWADSMECYTYLRNVTDLLSDGRRLMKDVLGNHLEDQLSRLVHWLSITLSLRKASQEFINLESLTWIVPWIRSVRGENLEG